MDFETLKSHVYIKVDDHGRITRCEGEYTLPSYLTGWILIEEGQPCDRLNLAQSHYFPGGLYTMDGIPRYKWDGTQAVERTEEELDTDRLPIIAAQARAQRDKLLLETDWTQTLDVPIDADTREAYRAYRQALRDIPEQEGFPRAIIWPELPAKTKAAPDPVDDAVDLLLSGATGEEVAE